jgi:hypothetical protein
MSAGFLAMSGIIPFPPLGATGGLGWFDLEVDQVLLDIEPGFIAFEADTAIHAHAVKGPIPMLFLAQKEYEFGTEAWAHAQIVKGPQTALFVSPKAYPAPAATQPVPPEAPKPKGPSMKIVISKLPKKG